MRSQVTAEFVAMVGIATMILLVFLYLFSVMINERVDEKKTIIAEDFIASIQNEFITASTAQLGYRRSFEIPDKIEGYEFRITNTDKMLLMNYTTPRIIPESRGVLQVGTNVIENRNGTVCVNC